MKLVQKYGVIILVAFVLSMFFKPVVCFIILGFLACYIGITEILFLNAIRKKGVECTGRILSYQAGTEGYKTPIIEFKTLHDEVISEKPSLYASSGLSKIRSYKKMINKEVAVLYDPENPKKFILVDEIDFSYFALIFCTLIGLVFLIVSVGSILGYIEASFHSGI